MKDTFYGQVESYYDGDAGDFDSRYWKNPVLQRIRQDFREQVKRHPFRKALEIGYGTGLDLVHFASTHPHKQFAGIDISGAMQEAAAEKIGDLGLENAVAHKRSVEDLPGLFPEQDFDMVFVFFGALNTVENLHLAAQRIYEVTMPGGFLVLSFVNRNYVAGMLIELLKLRFRAAFSRYRKEWGGYSPSQHLPSRCYRPAQIRRAFASFRLLDRQGYSILHPAWYYHGLARLLRPLLPALWKADKLLNHTPLWSWGEYSLFVFQKPDHIRK